MIYYSYSFESRTIQKYVFAGGKLRDIVAASNLLDQLTGSVLDSVLSSLSIQDEVRFSRRAGAAIYCVSSKKDCIERIARIWPLVVDSLLPGLETLSVKSEGSTEYDAIASGLSGLKIKRNFPHPVFPIVAPVAQRAQRTGEGAVVNELDRSENAEVIDLATKQKRKFSLFGLADGVNARDSLGEKFSPEGVTPVWPKALSPEPGIPQHDVLPLAADGYIGVVHIDGNGLGQLLIKLNKVASLAGESYASFYLAFSKAISDATGEAVKAAVEEVLKPENGKTVAARPLVLGGDDLTLIVAASLALPFSKAFIRAFEEKSSKALARLKAEFSPLRELCETLPEKLTACGGITYSKSSYPFDTAVALAEELCQIAKQESEAVSTSAIRPSSLSWHKVTTSSVSSAHQIFDGELSSVRNGKPLSLSLKAYSVTESCALPSLAGCESLVDLIVSKRKGGKLRDYLGNLKASANQASILLERMEETEEEFLKEFKELLDNTNPQKRIEDCFTFASDESYSTPLADVLALVSFRKSGGAVRDY